MSRCHATADKVELTVLTSSGNKHELQISLNDSLSQLKQQVLECTSIPIEHQRIFSMGREMKNNGRSLQTLGVGRFGIMVIHVQNTNPAGVHRHRGRVKRNARSEPIVLETSSSSSSNAPGRRSRSQQQHEIVELLDSDDEDDAKVAAACVIDMTGESSPTTTSRSREGSKRRRVS